MKSSWSIYAFILMVAVSSCSEKNSLIDNGATETRTVELDGVKYDLAAGKSEAIDLVAGEHKLSVKDVAGTALLDTTFTANGPGIVNAGPEGYVLWKLFYGLAKDRENAMKEDWTEIDSVKYFGEFKYYPPGTPYISKVYDLGPDEPVESEKNLVITKDYKVVRKLFRMEDFVKKYAEISKKKE